jgi:hypothetical protein
MQRTMIMGKVVLAAGAVFGVVVGLLLPTPPTHNVDDSRFIRPGYSAQ